MKKIHELIIGSLLIGFVIGGGIVFTNTSSLGWVMIAGLGFGAFLIGVFWENN